MKFSIIVPIYKVEAYLDKCVKSLINQTYNDIEIILIDDGSPDNCPNLCDEYAQKDSRIKVVHKENGGLSDARNAGLKVATGDYVVFVDSDDYIETDACEKFLKYTKSNCDIVIGDALAEGGNVNLSHISSCETMTGKEYLLKAHKAKKASMAAWLNIYKRDFLLNNKLSFKKGILHEDEEFTPRAFLAAQTVVCSGIRFYHYIIRENSIMTAQDKRKNAKDLYSTCLELEKIYNELDDKELKMYLKDSLVGKYLNMFQVGRLYQYGKEYFHKGFVLKNACYTKTRLKAMLYIISPRCYYKINVFQKKDKNKEQI